MIRIFKITCVGNVRNQCSISPKFIILFDKLYSILADTGRFDFCVTFDSPSFRAPRILNKNVIRAVTNCKDSMVGPTFITDSRIVRIDFWGSSSSTSVLGKLRSEFDSDHNGSPLQCNLQVVSVFVLRDKLVFLDFTTLLRSFISAQQIVPIS